MSITTCISDNCVSLLKICDGWRPSAVLVAVCVSCVYRFYHFLIIVLILYCVYILLELGVVVDDVDVVGVVGAVGDLFVFYVAYVDDVFEADVILLLMSKSMSWNHSLLYHFPLPKLQISYPMNFCNVIINFYLKTENIFRFLCLNY